MKKNNSLYDKLNFGWWSVLILNVLVFAYNISYSISIHNYKATWAYFIAVMWCGLYLMTSRWHQKMMSWYRELIADYGTLVDQYERDMKNAHETIATMGKELKRTRPILSPIQPIIKKDEEETD